MLVAQAVAELVRPIKMNYEIHGNTLPRLHVHLFPRQVDDPYVGGPVDPRVSTFERTDSKSRRSRLRSGPCCRRPSTAVGLPGVTLRTLASPTVAVAKRQLGVTPAVVPRHLLVRLT